MAKYVLEQLLDIRKKREDELAQQVPKAKSDLQLAEEECEKANRNLDDFVAELPDRKTKLYATVMNVVVKREQLDKLKEALADLERQRMALAEKLQQARRQVDEARQKLEQTQRNLLLATKNTMKLDTHKEAWLEEEKRIEQDNADKELEDLHTKVALIADDDDSL